MPDESKRLLIAVFLCLGILFVWQAFFPAAKPPAGAKEPSTAEKHSGTSPAADSSAFAGAFAGTETTATVRTGLFEALLTSRGGALKSYKLQGAKFRELRGGKEVPIELVQPGLGLPLEIALEKPLAIDRGQPWRVIQEGEREFSLVQESPSSRLSKRLRFDAHGWGADLTVQIENRTPKPQPARLTLSIHGRQPPGAPKGGFFQTRGRIWHATCHANDKVVRRDHDALRKEEVVHVGQVRWAGIEDKYFLLAAVPVADKQSLRCALSAGSDGALVAAISYAERTVAPGVAESYRLRLYLGPKSLEELDAVTVNGVDAELGDAVDYGWLRPVCRPMIWLLKWFFGFGHNWGVAIILLTIVVKLLTLYWTQKSMLSMRRMAQAGPEVQKLKDKYKDQKDRLNQEVMALYKRRNINPLGGCLPMLLQMPIWIALYTTISESVELYRSGFALWITDLAAPDRYYVMPIVLGGLTFLQTKMTPTPSQDPQAKMMGYMMPGMFLMFSLFVPSGLTLYWLVNTLLSMAHQAYMNRAHPLPAAAKGR